MWIPIHREMHLNERRYGSLQVLENYQTVDKHREYQVLVWRRLYDIPSSTVDTSYEHNPSNDPQYEDHEFDYDFTESLSTTLDIVLPYNYQRIFPDLKSRKNIIVVAHRNSLRDLVKHLGRINEGTISKLNIPNGTPLV